jgi:hypothetical protein
VVIGVDTTFEGPAPNPGEVPAGTLLIIIPLVTAAGACGPPIGRLPAIGV